MVLPCKTILYYGTTLTTVFFVKETLMQFVKNSSIKNMFFLAFPFLMYFYPTGAVRPFLSEKFYILYFFVEFFYFIGMVRNLVKVLALAV